MGNANTAVKPSELPDQPMPWKSLSQNQNKSQIQKISCHFQVMNSCSVVVVRSHTGRELLAARSTEKMPRRALECPDPQQPARTLCCRSEFRGRACTQSEMFREILSFNSPFVLHYGGCCGKCQKSKLYSRFLKGIPRGNKNTITSPSRSTVEAQFGLSHFFSLEIIQRKQ